MKRTFSSVFLPLVSLPMASFACGGGGDCDGMVLPPPEVAAPGPVATILSSLSEHSGLFAGLVIAGLIGIAVSRQVKLLETKSVSPTFGAAS